MRSVLTEQLSASGFDVRDSEDVDGVVAAVQKFRPDVVLVEEFLPRRAGRQVVLALRATGATFPMAVAGVLSDVSVPNILQWLRVGATDIWKFPFTREIAARTRELIDELDRSQVQLANMKTRLLAFTRRAKLSGTVTIFEGTPFEGAATFVEGELETGRFGTSDGEAALEQILELDDGPVTWRESGNTEPFAPAAVAGFKPRVLVAEDDAALRKLVMKQLEHAGYVTEGVADGQAALQLARLKPWDVVVADLDLPKLDGWGLLRELRTDVALREIAVMVLSAHEGAVDTLKAARAGARAYLKKGGKARQMLDAMALLASPRAKVWDSLSARKDTKVELRAVGPVWLLRTLAELDCQGTLELEDVMGKYSLSVGQGHLTRARAAHGSTLVKGMDAVRVLLASRGEGVFRNEQVTIPDEAPWVYEVLDETCAASRVEEQAKLNAAIAQPGKLFLNEELAELFARRATAGELRVLDAVKNSPDDLDGLVRAAGLPRGEVEPTLAELLRRGVLATNAELT
ncbi:MAG: response regulator [Archangium sp.]